MDCTCCLLNNKHILLNTATINNPLSQLQLHFSNISSITPDFQRYSLPLSSSPQTYNSPGRSNKKSVQSAEDCFDESEVAMSYYSTCHHWTVTNRLQLNYRLQQNYQSSHQVRSRPNKNSLTESISILTTQYPGFHLMGGWIIMIELTFSTFSLSMPFRCKSLRICSFNGSVSFNSCGIQCLLNQNWNHVLTVRRWKQICNMTALKSSLKLGSITQLGTSVLIPLMCCSWCFIYSFFYYYFFLYFIESCIESSSHSSLDSGGLLEDSDKWEGSDWIWTTLQLYPVLFVVLLHHKNI